MIDENYVKQKLAWIKLKITQLDLVEAKLAEMRQLAVYARDNILSIETNREFTQKMSQLQREVTQITEQDELFLIDAPSSECIKEF